MVKMFPRQLEDDEKTEVRSKLNLIVMFPSDYGSTNSREAVVLLCWGSILATGKGKGEVATWRFIPPLIPPLILRDIYHL